jgi:hypothetical protein
MALFNRTQPTAATANVDEQGPTLAELEGVISQGLDTVYRVGSALLQIMRRELYRGQYPSFEAYLDARWKMTSVYAHKLMEAAAICAELRKAGLPELTREAHARELSKVPSDKRSEVWRETLAAAGGKPEEVTAGLVAAHAEKHRKKRVRRKKPKTIVLKGKGWKLSLERTSVDIDPAAALNEALAKLASESGKKAA